jgi:hypothetical protein
MALTCAALTNPARYQRHRPEETTLYRVVQAHLDTYVALVDIETGGAGLPTGQVANREAFANRFNRLCFAACIRWRRIAHLRRPILNFQAFDPPELAHIVRHQNRLHASRVCCDK